MEKMESELMDNINDEGIPREKYKILRNLGGGSFSEIKLASHLLTDTLVAIKVIDKSLTTPCYLKSEVELLQAIQHQNIVKLFHDFDTPTRTYMVMEFIPGCDVVGFLETFGPMKETMVRSIIYQVALAIQYLHENQIVHRDIKGDNILMSLTGKAKLCDFGLAARVTPGQLLKDICGSIPYLAPEMLEGKSYEAKPVDLWSLGCVIYTMVTGSWPYDAPTPAKLHQLITASRYPSPKNVSRKLDHVISSLLVVDPGHRLDIGQLLGHPWLQDCHQTPQSRSTEKIPRIPVTTIVQLMLCIGFTLKEIVHSIKSKTSNECKEVYNIIKHKLSCGDNCSQIGKLVRPGIKTSPASNLTLPLRKTKTEPNLLTYMSCELSRLQDMDEEGSEKVYRRKSSPQSLSVLEMKSSSCNKALTNNCGFSNYENSTLGENDFNMPYFHAPCVDNSPQDGDTVCHPSSISSSLQNAMDSASNNTPAFGHSNKDSPQDEDTVCHPSSVSSSLQNAMDSASNNTPSFGHSNKDSPQDGDMVCHPSSISSSLQNAMDSASNNTPSFGHSNKDSPQDEDTVCDPSSVSSSLQNAMDSASNNTPSFGHSNKDSPQDKDHLCTKTMNSILAENEIEIPFSNPLHFDPSFSDTENRGDTVHENITHSSDQDNDNETSYDGTLWAAQPCLASDVDMVTVSSFEENEDLSPAKDSRDQPQGACEVSTSRRRRIWKGVSIRTCDTSSKLLNSPSSAYTTLPYPTVLLLMPQLR